MNTNCVPQSTEAERAHDQDKAIKKIQSDHENAVKEISKNENGITSKVNYNICLGNRYNIFMYINM